MLRILACVTQEHEPWQMGLALAICLAGAFAFVRLLRLNLTADERLRPWLTGAGAVSAGGTVWATHFIVMLAHRSQVPMVFDVGLTVISVIVTIATTWIGLGVVVEGGRERWWPLALGGCVVGFGIAAMHLLGMLALAIPGTLDFEATYMACALAIACLFSVASLWMATRGGGSRHRLLACLFFALAVVGHHFTALAGTSIVLDGRPVLGWETDSPWLAVAVAVAAATILAICAAASIIEQNLRLRSANRARVAELSVQAVRFQAALDNMIQGLCLFDAEGGLIVYNRRFEALFGTPLAGTTVSILMADPRLGRLFARPDPVHPKGCDGVAHELPDGRVIQVSRRAIPGAGWVDTYEDVTEARRSRNQLSHMALHDALTGLPNRVRFHEHLERALLLQRRERVALLCLDLDGFKGVNDTLGHPAGDELLCAVAARLRGCTREAELVARLGGDEFAIVLDDAQQPSEVTALSGRLVRALQEPFDLHGHRIVIGTSIGVALAEESSTADALLRNADIALYRAKEDGRGTWRLFEPAMDDEIQARRRLESSLRTALAGEQFELFYQPLMRTSTEALIGFEALIRWNHPQRGMVSPAEFIPVAEETGLIREMGAWLLRRACTDAAAWPRHFKVAVNLSPMQFLRGDLVREVEQALSESGLAASRLELEITESVLLQNNNATLGILHRLRGLGVRISMDDFGTGYSSLSYLHRFPFDKIKIDQCFVRIFGAEKGSVEIIRAIIGIGQALSMSVSAEGVETREQLRMLQAEGCDEVQGYLFSRPVPLREVDGLIARHAPAREGDADAGGDAHAPSRLSLVRE